MNKFIVFILISLCFTQDYHKTIEEIQKKLMNEQSPKNQNFSIVPPHWTEQKGLFRSDIHFYYLGGEVETEIRRHLKFPDLNMFVTNFVLTILLDIHELKQIDIDKAHFLDGIKSILEYQDKNFPAGLPIYRFWPIIQDANGTWVSWPPNLKNPLKYFPDFCKFLEWMCKLTFIKGCAEFVEDQCHHMEQLIQAFHIPADVDDASCNLGLGGLLEKMKDELPDSHKTWVDANVDYESFFRYLDQYSYKPFEKPASQRSKIDPRTYMYLSRFLDEQVEIANAKGEDPEVILPATWIQSIDEVRKIFPAEGMPFNVNNVDSNVATNFLYGATNFFLYHENAEKYATENVRKMYLNTAELLKWGIRSKELIRRPDIGLTYYPMVYDLFWFLGRTSFELGNYPNDFPFPEMKSVYDILNDLARNDVTIYILNDAKSDYSKGYVFWDDFLGDTPEKTLGEDRLFTTSLAINALLDIWSYQPVKGEYKRKYYPETPATVLDALDSAIKYLNEQILDDSVSHDNAFFSGSVKSMMALPYFYPGNYYQLLNGTDITQWPPEDMSLMRDDLICAMDGYVEFSDYENWKKMKFFGFLPPEDDTGHSDTFPYWSSHAMTYASAELALSKYIVTSK